MIQVIANHGKLIKSKKGFIEPSDCLSKMSLGLLNPYAIDMVKKLIAGHKKRNEIGWPGSIFDPITAVIIMKNIQNIY